MTYRTDTETHLDDPAFLATLRADGWRFESTDEIPHGFDPHLDQVVVFGRAAGQWRRYNVIRAEDLDTTLDGLIRGGWTDLEWDEVDNGSWAGKSLCEQNGPDLFCDSHYRVDAWPRRPGLRRRMERRAAWRLRRRA